MVETIETEDWKRERVTFAGVTKERIIAYVYLPKRTAKPFQCISFVPGGDIFYSRSASDYAEWLLAAHIKAGRAVMVLVPKGGVERPRPADYVSAKGHTVEYRDRSVLWVTEYRLGLDYLDFIFRFSYYETLIYIISEQIASELAKHHAQSSGANAPLLRSLDSTRVA